MNYDLNMLKLVWGLYGTTGTVILVSKLHIFENQE